MKAILCALFILLGTQVWAAPDMVYHQVPPNCNVVHLGSRWVIQDAQGFFVGYYTPAPPPVTYVAPAPAPRQTGPSYQGYAPGPSYQNPYSMGYSSGGYGYNSNYYYPQNRFQGSQTRSHHCGSGQSNRSQDGSRHCEPTQSPSQPLTQSGWYSFPTTTRSGF